MVYIKSKEDLFWHKRAEQARGWGNFFIIVGIL
jgi:hypothetical protein